MNFLGHNNQGSGAHREAANEPVFEMELLFMQGHRKGLTSALAGTSAGSDADDGGEDGDEDNQF